MIYYLGAMFVLGYGVAYGRQKLTDYLNKDYDAHKPDMTAAIKAAYTVTAEEEETADLIYEEICEALDKTSAGEWYLEKDGDVTKLMATHLDGGTDYHLADLTDLTKTDQFITEADAAFIVNARNSYIPSLLDELASIDEYNEEIIAYIDQALLNSKHTADDYKNILLEIKEKL